jgi:hypothetical protein
MKGLRNTVKSSLGLLMLGLSSSALATCPPIIACKTTAEASTIVGSNAEQELITFTQTITTDTNEHAQALIDMASANASSLSSGAQTLVAAQVELSQIEINQKLTVEKAMADRSMAHKTQMAENSYRKSTTIVSADDTKEEFELIIETLTDNSTMTVPEIVLLLRETMDKDDENGYVPVAIKAAEAICSDEDVSESGKCSVAKRIYPGQKLSTLYKQCSVNKRQLIEMERNQKAKVAAVELAEKENSKVLETTDVAGATTTRLAKQKELSCSPSSYKAGLCGSDMEPEDYQESIIIGNIIPNGDISAGNFNSPTASSSHGYIDDIDDAVENEIIAQSLDRDALINNPNQRAVDITHTYRNANQVRASMDFINNLVGGDLVPALSANDRRKASNAEYQARMLARTAAKSMVRLALNESMFDRVGEKMREMISEGKFDDGTKFEIKIDSADYKESVLGAGTLDILEDRIKQASASTQLASQNGDSANSGNDFIAEPSGPDALGKILASVSLQNDLLKKEYLMVEQAVVLEAISNTQFANSPEVVELMQSLRD